MEENIYTTSIRKQFLSVHVMDDDDGAMEIIANRLSENEVAHMYK